MIDLRSDTATLPSPGMRRAMAEADVGDEQRREDPTVLRLERMAAAFLGQEDAVYLPTATMANQIALAILGERGTELFVEATAHIMISELGGAAMHSGLQTRGVVGDRGRIAPEQLPPPVHPSDAHHRPRPSVLAIENTHNSSGGPVWPLADVQAVTAAARDLGMRLHLDGARVANAAVALGLPAAEVCRGFDTVTLCLSKGLGAPLGAVIAGSEELMRKARVEKHRFGGAMRQAGVIAAAGVYALEHNVARLADDHARARRLGEALVGAGVAVDLEQVQTNFVQIDVGAMGVETGDALQRLRDAGVGLTATVNHGVLRAVTHLDITDQDISEAISAIPAALGAHGGA